MDNGTKSKALYRDVYADTLYFMDAITDGYDFYPAILDMFKRGNISLELKQRFTTRSADELWISTLEDALPALDYCIRNPGKFIEERDEVLPIGLSRNITSRSLVHLAQHTDYISSVNGDEITPSKILNVFKDETLFTYENKFINTLINQLYLFVSRRREALVGNHALERVSMINLFGTFSDGKTNGKINFGIELNEPEQKEIPSNGAGTDIISRVERLYSVCSSYLSSELAMALGKSYIRPPVMRTNAIMKNKNLRQCLALWQFIGSYEGIGCEVSVHEESAKPDEQYISQLYSACALQYLAFIYKTDNGFAPEQVMGKEETQSPIVPRFVNELKSVGADEYDVSVPLSVRYIKRSNRIPIDDQRGINHAIDVAFVAEKVLAERRMQEAKRIAAEREIARKEAEKAEKEARKRAEIEHRRKVNNLPRKAKKKLRKDAARKAAELGISLPRDFDSEVFGSLLSDRKEEKK